MVGEGAQSGRILCSTGIGISALFNRNIQLICETEETGRGYKYIAKKYGVASSLVRLWMKRYKSEEIEGLIAKPGKYSGEFKESVLNI